MGAARASYGIEAWIISGIYMGLGLIPLIMAIYNLLLGWNIKDAQVFINNQTISLGGDFTVGIRQTVMKSLLVESVSAGLVCRETRKTRSGSKTTISTGTVYEHDNVVLENHNARAGERVELSSQLSVPADQNPSTSSKEYPRYMWQIHIVVKLAGSPDYKADFPIVIKPQSPSETLLSKESRTLSV